MALDTFLLGFLAAAFLVWGALWLFHRNDELPLAIAAFNAAFVLRLIAVERELATWANSDFSIGFSFDRYPNIAATYMLLGGFLLATAYCLAHRSRAQLQRDTDALLQTFLRKHRHGIYFAFAAFATINLLIRSASDDSVGSITDQSYAYLFTLAHSAFIILIATFLLYSKQSGLVRFLSACGLITLAAYLTLSPSLRFAILGWSVALAIIFTRKLKTFRRAVTLLGASIVIALAFSIAGALRQEVARELGPTALVDRGVTMLSTASDVNMVDGFVMLMQVYPEVLPYGLGSEHLHILTRPIPRKYWPEKPVGGWAQKYAVSTGIPLFNTGISPSLYGSFYGEGGVPGILIFSVLYGFLFAKYVNWANSHHSQLRWVLRGVLLSALFPLMRGGDLPGIVAFIGMSYWPLVVFVWMYHRSLQSKSFDAARVKARPGTLRAT